MLLAELCFLKLVDNVYLTFFIFFFLIRFYHSFSSFMQDQVFPLVLVRLTQIILSNLGCYSLLGIFYLYPIQIYVYRYFNFYCLLYNKIFIYSRFVTNSNVYNIFYYIYIYIMIGIYLCSVCVCPYVHTILIFDYFYYYYIIYSR